MKKAFQMPNTLALIFYTVMLMAVCTWIIPGGEYDRIESHGKQVPVAGSFRFIEHVPQSIQIFTAPVKGFADAVSIIAFLLIIGGAFGVIQETGAVAAFIKQTALHLGRNSTLRVLFIPVIMMLFSLGGAIFGMCEETMPFILIIVPLALSLGYDSLVGTAIPFLGAAAGFGGAFFNPFTVGIAQGFAGLPLYSGLPYRIIVWSVTTAVTIAFVMWYAARVHRDPSISPVYDLDQEKREKLHVQQDEGGEVTARHTAILLIFLAGIVLLVVGILKFKWFIEEIAALFFALGIICGYAGGLSSDSIAKSYMAGAKDMINPVLIIACARGILIIALDGKILDTILYYLASFISHFPPLVTAWSMFFVQSIINFFVHSGTGQAALTIPIMAPLSDLVGVTRQTAVLAFQLCELVNPVLPTSAVTMGILGLAGIPWNRWIKWFLPLLALYVLLAMALLVWPVLAQWN
ncbi:MAG: YfcC family protein [Candidatus Eremiobacteraeota bacterium]|nr:YfcC family protein [Candidatus Eremiobacteraeota bacterium]